MNHSSATSQRDHYRELLATAFATKERSDGEISSDQLLYVLELLTSTKYTDPEQQLAAWLKHAL